MLEAFDWCSGLHGCRVDHLARIQLFASWLLWRDVLLLFFTVGILSQLFTGSFMTATWNNMQLFCGEGANSNVVKCIWLQSHKTTGRKLSCEWRWWPWVELWKKWLSWAPRALRWIWSPVNMRNGIVQLSGNKRSHHSLQNIKNNAVTEPVPQKPEEMNHPGMYAFHSLGLVLASWHLLKQCQWKDWNTFHHETTELFIIGDY